MRVTQKHSLILISILITAVLILAGIFLCAAGATAYATDYNASAGDNSNHGEINPTEHVFTHYEAQAVTCEEDGMLAYSHCVVCDKNFIGGVEKSAEDLIIPALGHDYGEWTVTKPATATEDGEEQRACKNNPSHIETRAIPKIVTGQNHSIVLIIVVVILSVIVLTETVYFVGYAIRSKKARKEEKK
ncbi:MAG: hypothetical protein K2N18_06225 [Clostridia bacterium]|nr:hypothetical protein [Clostridia bacterium]